jgi:hypothetical protein
MYFAVGIFNRLKQARNVFVFLHVAGQEDFGLMRFEQLTNAPLAGRTGPMTECQLRPLGIQRLAYGPGDTVVVGHAHYHPDFAVENAHG